MSAYYNEFEPYAAEWLRNLIKAGLIPNGEVDTRSIVDVRGDDLRGFTQCHFFAGLGGWAYAARLAGWADDRPLWTGSCPCQPFSVAGKGEGQADARHLWPEWFRLIRECRPPIIFGEQVANAAGARPYQEPTLQSEIESLAREKSRESGRTSEGSPDCQSLREHDFGREEEGQTEKTKFRSGSIPRPTQDAPGSRFVRTDWLALQSQGWAERLEQSFFRQDRAGLGLRDLERESDLFRGERDDAHMGNGENRRDGNASDRKADCPDPDLSGAIPSEAQGETVKDWLDGVQSDLSGIGYTCGAAIAPSCAVDAPHRRDRLWFVADAAGGGQRADWRPQEAGWDDSTGHADIGSEGPHGGTLGHADGSRGAAWLPAAHGRYEGQPEVVDDGSNGRLGPWGECQGQGGRSDVADAIGGERDGRAIKQERGPQGGIALGWTGEGVGYVADADSQGPQQGQRYDTPARQGHPASAARSASPWADAGWIIGADGKARRIPQSGIRGVADGLPASLAGSGTGRDAEEIPLLATGIPARGGKLRALGNAIVPQVAAEVIRAVMDK